MCSPRFQIPSGRRPDTKRSVQASAMHLEGPASPGTKEWDQFGTSRCERTARVFSELKRRILECCELQKCNDFLTAGLHVVHALPVMVAKHVLQIKEYGGMSNTHAGSNRMWPGIRSLHITWTLGSRPRPLRRYPCCLWASICQRQGRDASLS